MEQQKVGITLVNNKRLENWFSKERWVRTDAFTKKQKVRIVLMNNKTLELPRSELDLAGPRGFINAAKNKLRNPLTFHMNANPGAKCKKRKNRMKHEKSDAKYPAVDFLFFAFRDRFCVFCDKCIASLRIFI